MCPPTALPELELTGRPRTARSLRQYLREHLPAPLARVLRKTGIPALVRSFLKAEPLYETDVCNVLERLVQSGWVCVDVGASVGVLTELMAKLVGPLGRVIAFEAHPDNARVLRDRVTAARFSKRVEVENLVVSDGAAARLWLHAGRGESRDEWNIRGRDHDGRPTRREVEVAATSLDRYFPSGSTVNLVKLDVEGAEALVLAGMRRLLREARPVVVVEFHDEEGWEGRKELLDAGYDLHDMNGTKLDPARDTERLYHVLALPRGFAS